MIGKIAKLMRLFHLTSHLQYAMHCGIQQLLMHVQHVRETAAQGGTLRCIYKWNGFWLERKSSRAVCTYLVGIIHTLELSYGLGPVWIEKLVIIQCILSTWWLQSLQSVWHWHSPCQVESGIGGKIIQITCNCGSKWGDFESRYSNVQWMVHWLQNVQ